MNVMSRLILALALLLVCSCSTTVTVQELRQQAQHAQSDTLGRVLYLGRSCSYDYFRIHRNVGWSNFRLLVPNGVIQEPQKYGMPPKDVDIIGLKSWVLEQQRAVDGSAKIEVQSIWQDGVE